MDINSLNEIKYNLRDYCTWVFLSIQIAYDMYINIINLP